MGSIYLTVKTISQDGLDTIAYDNDFYIEDGILYYCDEELARDVEDDLLYAAERITDYCHDTVLEITDDDGEVIYKNEEFDDEDLEDEEDSSQVIDFRFREDFRSLNETLEKFLNEDVVSFMDYKRRKQSDKFLKDNEEELNKQLDDFYSTGLIATIEKVKVLSCEGPIKNPHYEPGEEFSYENFQEDIWARDYINKIKDKYDKCNLTIYWSEVKGKLRIKTSRYISMRITIGAGKDECDVFKYLERYLNKQGEGEVVITNDPVEYNENYYKQLAKEYNVEKEEVEEEPLPAYVKDYTKAPEDVAVGDILTCSWGYSMTIVDYYRVTERKAKSIKLEKLATKTLTGGGYQGTCMPSDERAADRFQTDIQNKLFRIGVKWSKDVVCQINGHSVYYWDGKPDHYDHMD